MDVNSTFAGEHASNSRRREDDLHAGSPSGVSSSTAPVCRVQHYLLRCPTVHVGSQMRDAGMTTASSRPDKFVHANREQRPRLEGSGTFAPFVEKLT